MPELSITVAVCTFNRARLLQQALNSVVSQTLDPQLYEILVVDNGSSDGTQDVIAGYLQRYPPIRYVWESRAGISHARNRAVADARGKYLAFLDDDATADPRWLEALARALEVRPAPGCIAGPVVLTWEGGRPSWFPTWAEPLLCHYDMGNTSRFLGPEAYVLTTNVLFDRHVLEDLGGFRSYLGRKRGQPLGGEDNEIYQRLLRSGCPVFYQPSARVYHGVPRERQSRAYLARRMYWDGASQPLLDHGVTRSRRFYAVEAARDLKSFAGMLRQTVVLSLHCDLRASMDSILRLLQRAGRVRTNILLSLRRIR